MIESKEDKPPKLTAKQRNFLKLIPDIETGKLTIEAAMKKAGYADSTARQQKEIVDSLRQSSAMQKALRQAGVDEKLIAGQVLRGIKESEVGTAHKGYVEVGAKLLDAFPASRNINADATVDQLLDDAENDSSYSPMETVDVSA